MSEAKHTPGPWEISERECGLGCHCKMYDINAQYPEDTEAERNLMIVGTANGQNAVWLKKGETDANARLIAAAPELLEALQYMLDNYKANEAKGLGIGPIMKAKAAIAKATGGDE